MLPILVAVLFGSDPGWTPAWHCVPGDGAATLFNGGVTLSTDGAQKTQTHPRAIATLPPALGTNWRLTFDVRYTRLGEAGSRISLERNGTKWLWTGADADYNKMSSFIGSDMVDTRDPSVGITHHFEFRRDGKNVIVMVDGISVGKRSFEGNPDSLFVGGDDSRTPATTTELELTNVHLSEGSATPRSSVSSAGATPFGNRLGFVLGVDATIVPPAVPSSAGLRVSAREAKLQLLPGSVLELAPVCDRPDFQPSEVALVVDGKIVRRERVFGKTLPIFSQDLPKDAGTKVRIQILAADDHRRQAELMRLDVVLGLTDSQLISAATVNEKVGLSSPRLRRLYVFLSGEYLGCVEDAAKLSIDVRRLPPGQRDLRFVATSPDGFLLPPFRSLIDVHSRYRLSSDYDHGVLKLEGNVSGTNIRVSVASDASPAETRIYLRGQLIATRHERSFDFPLPMGDIASGDALVEVVGVCADQTTYPAETLTIRVSNPVWDSLRIRDERTKQLETIQTELEKDDENVAYWYQRAISEPAFKTSMMGHILLSADEFGRVVSLSTFSVFSAPGDAGLYLGECKAAVAIRAAHRLQLGKMQKTLGLIAQARSTLSRCLEEAGASSATGAQAKAELGTF